MRGYLVVGAVKDQRLTSVGIRSRLGNTPQHGVLFGMTGAGKSVIIADLLAQIGHRFGFRLIVEEGLSHAVRWWC
jgi:type IV secretory pathway VirB4 component